MYRGPLGEHIILAKFWRTSMYLGSPEGSKIDLTSSPWCTMGYSRSEEGASNRGTKRHRQVATKQADSAPPEMLGVIIFLYKHHLKLRHNANLPLPGSPFRLSEDTCSSKCSKRGVPFRREGCRDVGVDPCTCEPWSHDVLHCRVKPRSPRHALS